MSASPKKVAVVVIHGMGEQTPMATLRGFVKAVWSRDPKVDKVPGLPNETWAKPDRRNRSFELRRITTRKSAADQRIDFYEFYWAHLMHGTTRQQVTAWLFKILWRMPWKVPKELRGVWSLLWLAIFAVVANAGFALIRRKPDADAEVSSMLWGLEVVPNWGWVLGTAIGAAILTWITNVFVLKYFGDVARYTSATPENVARRQEIREKGVELLETLLPASAKEGEKRRATYDRIIVVGHSLGSIIAYDILKYTFARVNRDFLKKVRRPQPARLELEEKIAAAIANEDGPTSLTYEELAPLQDAARDEYCSQGGRWIVSDFITLGSPLTHAEFLLAEDEDDAERQKEERILPSSPPKLEPDNRTGLEHFTYWPAPDPTTDQERADLKDLTRIPHHAAHFAYTKWINIYSPHWMVLFGDIISGPVRDQFAVAKSGQTFVTGIKDIPVMAGDLKRGRPPPFFTHTKYWKMGEHEGYPAKRHIDVLRKALNLKNDPSVKFD